MPLASILTSAQWFQSNIDVPTTLWANVATICLPSLECAPLPAQISVSPCIVVQPLWLTVIKTGWVTETWIHYCYYELKIMCCDGLIRNEQGQYGNWGENIGWEGDKKGLVRKIKILNAAALLWSQGSPMWAAGTCSRTKSISMHYLLNLRDFPLKTSAIERW